jgi:ferrous iron transport protein B
VVIALNQFDVAQAEGIVIDVPELIHELGVAVVPTVASNGEGIDPLKRALLAAGLPAPARRFELPPAARSCSPRSSRLSRGGWRRRRPPWRRCACSRSTGRKPHLAGLAALQAEVAEAVAGLRQCAASRPTGSSRRCATAGLPGSPRRTVARHDGGKFRPQRSHRCVVLHRVFGPLLFLALMALVFQSVFTWATPFMDGIEAASVRWGRGGRAHGRRAICAALVVDGVFAGVGSVLVFLPQIAILFAFITCWSSRATWRARPSSWTA